MYYIMQTTYIAGVKNPSASLNGQIHKRLLIKTNMYLCKITSNITQEKIKQTSNTVLCLPENKFNNV